MFLKLPDTATGKALLVAILVAIVELAVSAVWIILLYADLRVAKSEIATKQATIDGYTIIFETNRVDYEKKIKDAENKSSRIEIRYIPVTKEIIKWEKEANASDCNGAMRYLDSFPY